YFTMTGDHLAGTPASIESRQAELDALHADTFGTNGRESTSPQVGGHAAPSSGAASCTLTDDDTELLGRAFAAPNGEKFSKVWEGDTSDYDGDHSAAEAGPSRPPADADSGAQGSPTDVATAIDMAAPAEHEPSVNGHGPVPADGRSKRQIAAGTE